MTTTDRSPAPTTPAPAPEGVAQRLARVVEPFVGGELPVRLQCWDGSVAGAVDGLFQREAGLLQDYLSKNA